MIHHMVVGVLHLCSKELHGHIDSSILVIHSFFFLFPTQVGASSAEKVHQFSVIDTKCYQVLAVWVILQHSRFCCPSDCHLLISLNLFLQNASRNSMPLLSAHTMNHDAVFSSDCFSGKSSRNVEIIQANDMIFSWELVKQEKDS